MVKNKTSSKPSATPVPAVVAPEGRPLPRKKPIFKSGNAGNSASAVVATKDATDKLFGSWTGKVPLSLLNEHCQKRGWDRPVVDAKKLPNVCLAWHMF